MSTEPNKPIIFEISTDKGDEVEKFYANVFPWQFNQVPATSEYDYKFIGTDGFDGNLGGIWRQTGPELNWSVCGIMVDPPLLDDAVENKIEAAGGEITWQMDSHVDEFGELKGAQFRDPSGNLAWIFSFITAENSPST